MIRKMSICKTLADGTKECVWPGGVAGNPFMNKGLAAEEKKTAREGRRRRCQYTNE